MPKFTQNAEMFILEEETEVQQTKAYGIGIDCHSKFIQVSVYVKRDLKFFEYRHEFATDWNFLTSAPQIGEVTAITWLAHIITQRRFPNAKAVAAYCDPDPSLKVSAEHVTSTVKRSGCKELHKALMSSVIFAFSRIPAPYGFRNGSYLLSLQAWRSQRTWKKFFGLIKDFFNNQKKYKSIHNKIRTGEIQNEP